MEKSPFGMEIEEIKEKFSKFYQHRKQINALQNYNLVKSMSRQENKLFRCVKECIQIGFLDGADESYLSHLLEKMEINYLDWSHKTKWVKSQISKKSEKIHKVIPVQTYFDFAREPTVQIPLSIVAKPTQRTASRM